MKGIEGIISVTIQTIFHANNVSRFTLERHAGSISSSTIKQRQIQEKEMDIDYIKKSSVKK